MKVQLLKSDGSLGSVDLDLNLDTNISDYAIGVVSRVAKQNSKQGTKKAKGRSEVTGRAKKPYKQKGTGGARQGSRKGPHMRGGGVSHGPQPDFRKLALNKKFSRLVLKKLVSKHIESETLALVDLSDVKKELRNSVEPKSLVVYSKANKESARSLKNIAGVKMIEAGSFNPTALVSVRKVYIDSDVKDKLVEILK